MALLNSEIIDNNVSYCAWCELPGRKPLCWGSVQSWACSGAVGHLALLVTLCKPPATTLLNIHLWGREWPRSSRAWPQLSLVRERKLGHDPNDRIWENPGRRRLPPLQAHSSAVGLRLCPVPGSCKNSLSGTNMLLFWWFQQSSESPAWRLLEQFSMLLPLDRGAQGPALLCAGIWHFRWWEKKCQMWEWNGHF